MTEKVNRQGRTIAYVCDLIMQNKDQISGLSGLVWEILKKSMLMEAEILQARIDSYKREG